MNDDRDVELGLLLDAIYRKYHYDFRGYAEASLKRRIALALDRFHCATLSRLQERLLHEPAVFTELRGQWQPSYAWLLDRDGVVLEADRVDYDGLRSTWVPLAEMSPALKSAVIEIEAENFVFVPAEKGPANRTFTRRPVEIGRRLGDRVVIKRVEEEAKTKGGIIIPDTAKEKPQEGEVVAVGPGARNDKGDVVALDVKAGDRILFGKWSGTEVKVDGQDLLIMKESDVLGVVEA